MKKISLFLSLALVLSLLCGCAGTPVVYYSNCTCPTGSHDAVVNVPETTAPQQTEEVQLPAQGALKTGLYIAASIGESVSAGEENGEAKYDLTIVAVLVDDEGIIHDCVIDSVGASIAFDGSGSIVTDLTAPVLTKNELGEDYGMVAWGNAIAEWDAQAAALANFVKGKHFSVLTGGAIGENGYAADADLASSATIYLGGYAQAIELAVGAARHLGAQAGDSLRLAVNCSTGSSASASAEASGNAQLDVDVAAVSMNGETITSCVIDSVQAKVAFDQSGTITSEIGGAVSTKNQLGEQYGMKAWGNAIAEWDQQAAAFSAYVTGKTAAEVAGIAVDEGTKPTDADLTASVTIAIGGFQALIAKACQ